MVFGPKKRRVALLCLGLVVAGILWSAIAILGHKNQKEQVAVCSQGNCFETKIADDPQKRAAGLMFQKSLGENQGMIFVFPAERVSSFWMKNMQISLDLVWLDKEKRITYLKKNAPPCPQEGPCPLLVPSGDALYVLELRAGVIDGLKIKEGDKFDFGRELTAKE